MVRTGIAMMLAVGMSAASATAQPFVYVLGQTDDPAPGNRGVQIVTIINASTNTKVGSVQAGLGCQCIGAQVLAISPDGAALFVANQSGDSVTVIATATHTVSHTLGSAVAGTFPVALAVSPDNSRLYVLGGSGSVTVVDLASRSRIATIPLSVPQSRGMAVTPDGARLYVSTYGSDSVKVVDTASLSVVRTIPVAAGGLPTTVDLTPDGRYVYVATPFVNTVAVIETQSNSVVATIPVGARPYSVGVTPGGSRVYSVNGTASSLSHIDPQSRTVVGTVTGVFNGNAIDFTPNGATAYVAGFAVYAVSTATNAVTATIPFSSATDGHLAAIVVTPPAIAPPTNPSPRDLVASSIVGNAVTLRWTAPTGSAPTGYVLEGGVSPGEVLASVPTGSAAPIFSFSAPSGAFYVRVHALTAQGKSPASNEVRLFVNSTAAPSAPTGLVGLANGSTLSLAWTNTFAGGTPASVVLDVRGSLTGSVPLGAVDAFTVPGVPAGTYTLSVRAMNASGASAASNPVTLTFPSNACAGAPQTPANVVAFRTGNVITVRWDPAATGPAPAGFVLRVSGAFVGSLPLSGRSISAAVPPGTYTFHVSASNACGQSADAIAQSVTVP